AGGLVDAREGGVRENVVGRQVAELLRRLDGLVPALEVVQGERQALPRVGELGVAVDRGPVRRDRVLELAVRDQVDGAAEQLPLVGHVGMATHSTARGQAAGGGEPPALTAGPPPCDTAPVRARDGRRGLGVAVVVAAALLAPPASHGAPASSGLCATVL